MSAATPEGRSKAERGRIRPGAKPVDTPAWPAVPPRDYAHLSLEDLLRQRLSQVIPETKKTWAQQLIEAWIGEALGGNFRALQEIVERIDGDHPDEPASPIPRLDETTARKILEILCDPNDDLPSD